MQRKPTSGTNAKLKISIEPNIGLDGDARHSVVDLLNTILADEQVLLMKTRAAGWHVRGPGFLDFQTLFQQQVQQMDIVSGEIAERVCVLGGFALSSFEESLNSTRLEELPGEAPDIMALLADHEAIVRFLREDARKCFEEYEDQGTFGLFVNFIRLHEKMAWILRSYIEPETTQEENPGNKRQVVQR